MLKRTEIDILEEKIDVIKNSPDESCKYLVNVFNTYKNIVDKKVNTVKNTKYKKIKLINNIQEIQNTINICEKTTIISFEKINYNIEEYYRLLDEYTNLKILVVSNKKSNFQTKNKNLQILSFKENGMIKKLNRNISEKIIVHINLDALDITSDWEINLIKNFEKILKRYNNHSLSEINKNKNNIALDSILLKNKVEIYFDKSKLRAEVLIKVLKKIMNNLTKKINIEGTITFLINTNDELDYLENIKTKEIITAIEILKIKNKKEKIEYIYDNLCSRIQKDLSNYKYCDFEKDKCIAQRDVNNKNDYPVNSHNGCCYKVEKKQECDRLKDKQCTTECISCRLFICRYLKDRGVSYEVKDNLQIRMFLNFLQKPVLVWNFFETREKIIKELLKW